MLRYGDVSGAVQGNCKSSVGIRALLSSGVEHRHLIKHSCKGKARRGWSGFPETKGMCGPKRPPSCRRRLGPRSASLCFPRPHRLRVSRRFLFTQFRPVAGTVVPVSDCVAISIFKLMRLQLLKEKAALFS